MDGDEAPLAELVALCGAYRALLILDEAHAVLGPELPQPPARSAGASGRHPRRLGRRSDRAARGHPVEDARLAGWLRGLPRGLRRPVRQHRPAVHLRHRSPARERRRGARRAPHRPLPEGDALVARLRSLVDRVAPGHPSPIVPIVLGSDERALRAAAFLLERGLLVPAIRPPTVPVGSARLRVTLSAAAHRRAGRRAGRRPARAPGRGGVVSRPQRVVVVFGTATEIGKTWFGATTITELVSHGVGVAHAEPAQVARPRDPHPPAAEVLAAAAGADPALVPPCAPVAPRRPGAPHGGRPARPPRSSSPTSWPR